MAEAAALEAFGRLFLPKVTFGSFSGWRFAGLLARILLAFEAFGSGFPRLDFELLSMPDECTWLYSRRVSCAVGGFLSCF